VNLSILVFEKALEISQQTVLGATGGDWIKLVVSYFTNFKNWILTAFGAVGLVRIAWEGYKYKQGDDMERNEATKKIKSSVGWYFGLPFALWLAADIWARSKGML
jgi:hypothetical protein